MLRADTAARAARIRLQLVVDHAPVARVLALLDLDRRLCVRPDLAAARRAALG